MLCLIMPAIPMPAQAQTEAVYTIGRFSFENGSEIADMKVGYVTWGKEYNEYRPHSSIGDITPAEFLKQYQISPGSLL
jgi:hypothetical protein